MHSMGVLWRVVGTALRTILTINTLCFSAYVCMGACFQQQTASLKTPAYYLNAHVGGDTGKCTPEEGHASCACSKKGKPHV